MRLSTSRFSLRKLRPLGLALLAPGLVHCTPVNAPTSPRSSEADAEPAPPFPVEGAAMQEEETKSRAEPMPRLAREGGRTRLLVDEKPYFILGGELGNSSASSEAYMEPIWPKLQAMHVNTVLAPVYWELIEPSEGKFDFDSLRFLIERARKEEIRLVLLWFGSWKNSMSCYAPSWVKRDDERFPRARDKQGTPQEILSPFDERNREADKKAFVELMKFIRTFDSEERTVIMVQVENEIGMLPEARDHHPAATRAFEGEVPPALRKYLEENESHLVPEVRAAWDRAKKKSGSWAEAFGPSLATDEIFMAWHFGRYVEGIAAAGKKEYALPLFLNAALNRPGVKPGDYPSAGPLPHLMDIWKAATPSIDLLVPDFYNPRFSHWNDLYTQQGDPLFIPEIRFDETVGAKAFFAFGHYDTLGFSPFSIESTDAPAETPLARSYELLHQILPTVLSRDPKDVEGVWLTKEDTETSFTFDGYRITAKHDLTLGWDAEAKEEEWPHAGALFVRVSEEEYFAAGTGVVFTFESLDTSKRAGIDQIYEGQFEGGKWKPGRSMNGDQSHQGRHLRIPNRAYQIQKLRLYSYR